MLRYWPIILAVLYFIFPYDLLPDFFPGMGRIDDLLIFGYLYWIFYKKYKQSSRSESRTYANGGERVNSGSTQSSNNSGAHKKQPKDPYAILGTNRQASVDEIKHAYRIQANRYHPDKVSHLGEEFQALAKEKFQDIQWAYEQVMRGRT